MRTPHNSSHKPHYKYTSQLIIPNTIHTGTIEEENRLRGSNIAHASQ